MLGSAIIVFREVLEASLVIAVVMGATRGVSARGRWVLAGVSLGIVGAVLVAVFAGAISDSLAGRGQEVFNAAVLLTAVLMLGWHNVWMSSHGKKLAEDMRAVGHDVTVGAKPLSLLLVVTSLAVLREGSETVLFLYSLAAGGSGTASLLSGGALGLAAGAGAGWLLYRGLLRIPVRHFFSVTGWLVLLLAGGLAASAAGYLSAADLVPTLGGTLWNTSNILSQHSWLGTLLHVLVGYTDRPTGVQLLFYILTVVATLSLMYWVRQGVSRQGHREARATAR